MNSQKQRHQPLSVLSLMVIKQVQKEANLRCVFMPLFWTQTLLSAWVLTLSRWHNSSVYNSSKKFSHCSFDLADADLNVVSFSVQTLLTEIWTAARSCRIRRGEVKGAGQPQWGIRKCSCTTPGIRAQGSVGCVHIWDCVLYLHQG